jgi:hypothetical protein
MNPVIFVIIGVAVFVALYLFFRKIHPLAGTLGVNLAGVAAIVLDYANSLVSQAQLIPWHDLLDEGRAKLVMLIVLIGNMVIRTLRKDPAPPSA